MFSSDAITFFQTFFSGIVSLFNISIPGTNVTFLQVGLSVICTVVVIGLAKQFIGFGVSIFGGLSSSISQNKERNDKIKSKYKRGE